MSAHTQPQDPRQAIAELHARLMRVPPDSRPREHAALQYSLGLAHAELPDGDRTQNFSQALRCYGEAERLLEPDRFPLEHALVQSAKGAALRELGRPAEAAEACQTAVALLEEGPPRAELGAALNNLGLARSEVGEHEAAIEALSRAVDVFERTERRQRPIALLNLGQAHDATGAYDEAVKTYEQALTDLDPEEEPYHWGVLQHALGVSLSALGWGEQAASAFAASLRVFTPQRYPFQYALAKNNYGLAWAQVGGAFGLRRAVAAYEDALRMFDPRLHRPQWEQAYRNLQLAEDALRDLGEDHTRAEHFARLLADLDDTERERVMRERMMTYFAMPENTAIEALAELDVAGLQLPDDEAATRVSATWINVLMELPNTELLTALKARLAAHRHLEGAQLERAHTTLDQVIQQELLAPQRIRVRDTLEMLGWER